MGLAIDHTPIGAETNLHDEDWNIAGRMRRGEPKPRRWKLKPENTHKWETSIHKWCDNWDTTMDTADALELLQRLHHLGGGRRRNTPNTAQSQLENELKHNITRVDISGGYLTKLRQQLFQERGRNAKHKELNHDREVLKHQWAGGWGKQAMAPPYQPMTTRTLDDGTILTHPDDIATVAMAYYERLFRPTTTDHTATAATNSVTRRVKADEEDLHRWLQVEWDYWEWPQGTISQGDVTAAILEAKAGKTCGADGIVTKQWQAAVAADPRIAAGLAWAWNQRLQNRAEVRQAQHTISAHALVQPRSASEDVGSTRHASEFGSPKNLYVPPLAGSEGLLESGASTVASQLGSADRIQASAADKPACHQVQGAVESVLEEGRTSRPRDRRRRGTDTAMQGLRRGFQCAELIHSLREVSEKATE